MMQNNSELNMLLIEARSGSIYHQKMLYKKCQTIIQPLVYHYSHYALKFGINRQDLLDIMNETFLKILVEDIEFYENFQSYYRKKYEFDVLRLFKSLKTRKNAIFIEALKPIYKEDGAENIETISSPKDNDNDFRKRLEIVLILQELFERKDLNKIECEIVERLLNGFKIIEIVPLLNVSEYKVRTSIKKVIKKIIAYEKKGRKL